MTVTIRNTRQEDLLGVMKLLSKYDMVGKSLNEEKFRALLRRDGRTCYVAEKRNKIIGSAFGINVGGVYGYVGKVVVDERYRRGGIGSKLIKEVLVGLKGFGVSHVFLHVRKGNEVSVAFFRSLGFNVRDHYLMDNE